METDGTRSASPDRASGDSIRRSVRGRKADTRAQAEAMSLPLLQDGRIAPARLVPVGPWILDDEECIRSIRDWRERNMTMFFTQFESTREGTVQYLENLAVGDEQRILFMILDCHGSPLGHLGLLGLDESGAEVDNVMRGPQAWSGLMLAAHRALLHWCFADLGLPECTIRVFSYNTRAIALYQRVGFAPVRRIPLRREVHGTVVTHSPCAPQDSNVDYWCEQLRIGPLQSAQAHGADAAAIRPGGNPASAD